MGNLGARESSLLDEVNKFRAGLSDHSDIKGVSGDEAVEFIPAQGGLGGENADDARLSHLNGGFYTRFHADEGNGVVGTKGLDRNDGGGITGEDDELRTLGNEIFTEGEGALNDLGVTFITIWAPCGIAKIGDALLGQKGAHFSENRETTDARIKDAYHREDFDDEIRSWKRQKSPAL